MEENNSQKNIKSSQNGSSTLSPSLQQTKEESQQMQITLDHQSQFTNLSLQNHELQIKLQEQELQSQESLLIQQLSYNQNNSPLQTDRQQETHPLGDTQIQNERSSPLLKCSIQTINSINEEQKLQPITRKAMDSNEISHQEISEQQLAQNKAANPGEEQKTISDQNQNAERVEQNKEQKQLQVFECENCKKNGLSCIVKDIKNFDRINCSECGKNYRIIITFCKDIIFQLVEENLLERTCKQGCCLINRKCSKGHNLPPLNFQEQRVENSFYCKTKCELCQKKIFFMECKCQKNQIIFQEGDKNEFKFGYPIHCTNQACPYKCFTIIQCLNPSCQELNYVLGRYHQGSKLQCQNQECQRVTQQIICPKCFDCLEVTDSYEIGQQITCPSCYTSFHQVICPKEQCSAPNYIVREALQHEKDIIHRELEDNNTLKVGQAFSCQDCGQEFAFIICSGCDKHYIFSDLALDEGRICPKCNQMQSIYSLCIDCKRISLHQMDINEYQQKQLTLDSHCNNQTCFQDYCNLFKKEYMRELQKLYKQSEQVKENANNLTRNEKNYQQATVQYEDILKKINKDPYYRNLKSYKDKAQIYQRLPKDYKLLIDEVFCVFQNLEQLYSTIVSNIVFCERNQGLYQKAAYRLLQWYSKYSMNNKVFYQLGICFSGLFEQLNKEKNSSVEQLLYCQEQSKNFLQRNDSNEGKNALSKINEQLLSLKLKQQYQTLIKTLNSVNQMLKDFYNFKNEQNYESALKILDQILLIYLQLQQTNSMAQFQELKQTDLYQEKEEYMKQLQKIYVQALQEKIIVKLNQVNSIELLEEIQFMIQILTNDYKQKDCLTQYLIALMNFKLYSIEKQRGMFLTDIDQVNKIPYYKINLFQQECTLKEIINSAQDLKFYNDDYSINIKQLLNQIQAELIDLDKQQQKD